jgi:predicted GIY-YIG superfamily endonuclease
MNSKSGVLYIGATSDLDRRVFEHKSGLVEGFTKKYRVTRLTYVEEFDRAAEMVARERHLKRWTRRKKLELIQRHPEIVDTRGTARGPSTPAAFAQDDTRNKSFSEEAESSLKMREGPVKNYPMPDTTRLPRLCDRQAAGAFLLYLVLSGLIFGRAIVEHPASVYVGRGPDPQLYIWFMAWWAFAISHGVNPFLTSVIWAPSGVNLAWTANMPLAAWLVYPITRICGPIVAYNVLCLLTPAFAGWSAFVLCRYVAHKWWPALLGGLLFAFSPYVLSRMLGNMDLTLVWPIPLAAYVTLRRIDGNLGARGFVAALAILIAAQFLSFAEIVASASLFGAIAFLLAAPAMAPLERRRLFATATLVAAAYAVAAVIVSPYLYYMFAFPASPGGIFSPWHFAIDVVSLVIPTTVNQLGRVPFFAPIAYQFRAELAETGAYLGLPLLAIVILFARERWNAPGGRFLVHLLAVICVLAMGPRLEFGGRFVIGLPGSALARLPLLDKALPARFMLYAYLVAAVMVAAWLAQDRGRTRGRKQIRWALGLGIVPFMLPNLSASYWTTPAAIPSFFSAGLYRQYLAPGETVIVLPYGILGEAMLWQAASGMYFRMAEGYVTFAPPVPEQHRRWPIVAGLYQLRGVPAAGDQFKAYLASNDVGAVIVGPRRQYRVGSIGGRPTATTWLRAPTLAPERDATSAMLASLGVPAVEAGGVTLYQLSPHALAPYRNLTALAMEQRAARARFEALLLGAERYLDAGGDLASLNPEHAQQLGLLPQGWFGGAFLGAADSNPIFHSGSVLGPAAPNGIAVGIEGQPDALEPIIRSYGAYATRIYFPYSAPFVAGAAPHAPAMHKTSSMMVLMFDRAGLARAAASAAQAPAR